MRHSFKTSLTVYNLRTDITALSGLSAQERPCYLEFVHSFVTELFSSLVSYTEEDGPNKIYLPVMNFVTDL